MYATIIIFINVKFNCLAVSLDTMLVVVISIINNIKIGKINASVGVRVDWIVENKEHTSLNLYFLSGQIISYPLKRNPDKLIQAFFMNEDLKSVKMGNEVKSCLLYEDTKEGKLGQMLEQWAKSLNEQEFLKKVAVELKSYYVISYKIEKL